MVEDKLAFLDTPRDERGRFASAAETQPGPVEAQPQPLQGEPPPPVEAQEPQQPAPVQQQKQIVEPVQKQPDHIPISALLDEREKRQRYERDVEELRKRLDEATRQPRAPVDPLIDPEAFQRQYEDGLRETEWKLLTKFSHMGAVRQHGAEVVNAAEAWVKDELSANPGFWQTIQSQSDPYDFVVRQHKRHLSLAKIGESDPEAWAEQWAVANGYVKPIQPTQAAVAGAPIPQPTPLPRPSLASAPSAASKSPNVPMGPGASFEAVFKS